MDNAFALPTALTAIFRIHSPTPSSRSSEQPLLRFYRGDIYSDAGGIRVTRHVPDVPPPAYYRRMREFTTNLDRWFIDDFLLPGTLLMHSGGRPTQFMPRLITTNAADSGNQLSA